MVIAPPTRSLFPVLWALPFVEGPPWNPETLSRTDRWMSLDLRTGGAPPCMDMRHTGLWLILSDIILYPIICNSHRYYHFYWWHPSNPIKIPLKSHIQILFRLLCNGSSWLFMVWAWIFQIPPRMQSNFNSQKLPELLQGLLLILNKTRGSHDMLPSGNLT